MSSETGNSDHGDGSNFPFAEAGISTSVVYEPTDPAYDGIYLKSKFAYSRFSNPCRELLEKNCAAIDGADHGIAFASCMAAINACFMGLLKSGDHVVLGADCYVETSKDIKFFEKFGIEQKFVHRDKGPGYAESIIKGRTKIVYLESPANPRMHITDLSAVASAVKAVDPEILVIVDNTIATSYLQKPIQLGADIVIQSMTKYLGGSNDLVMGIACTSNKDAVTSLRKIQQQFGPVPSAFDCYLADRGLKTLAIRMDQHSENALTIAKWLDKQDLVTQVNYAGLPSFEGHEIAKKQSQQKGFSGLLSFHLKAQDAPTTWKFLQLLKLFQIAGTFGGPNSMCDSPTLSAAGFHLDEFFEMLGVDHTLVRLSVGIEDVNDLIADLQQAFDGLTEFLESNNDKQQ